MPEPRVLGEQYGDLEQQRSTAQLGLWVFLATEVMLFSGLFLGYTVYRFDYPHGFLVGSRHLKFWLGTINTGILLTSSLTMASSIHAIQDGKREASALLLLATAVLGIAFLGVKATEWVETYQEHLLPGTGFVPPGGQPLQGVQMFFFMYYTMTGLHAVHLTIGVLVVLFMLLRVLFGNITAQYSTPVELTGLYWHLVDVFWVFLYPLLYLIR